jgi:hypothetical protein
MIAPAASRRRGSSKKPMPASSSGITPDSKHHRQCATKCGLFRWWLRNGTLNCPLVVFSVPMKRPKQKALIVSAHAAAL